MRDFSHTLTQSLRLHDLFLWRLRDFFLERLQEFFVEVCMTFLLRLHDFFCVKRLRDFFVWRG